MEKKIVYRIFVRLIELFFYKKNIRVYSVFIIVCLFYKNVLNKLFK